MTDEPRVWATQIMMRSEHIFTVWPLEDQLDREFFMNHELLNPVDPGTCPPALYVKKGRAPKGDLFTMINMVVVVSEELADLISSFDTGAEPNATHPDLPRTELLRMPLFARDQKTKLRDVAILYVCNEKNSFMPDQSETFYDADQNGRYGMIVGEQRLVVNRKALLGEDIWRERHLRNAIFFSDRLVQAMAAAKMKPMKAIYPCEVVEG